MEYQHLQPKPYLSFVYLVDCNLDFDLALLSGLSDDLDLDEFDLWPRKKT